MVDVLILVIIYSRLGALPMRPHVIILALTRSSGRLSIQRRPARNIKQTIYALSVNHKKVYVDVTVSPVRAVQSAHCSHKEAKC